MKRKKGKDRNETRIDGKKDGAIEKRNNRKKSRENKEKTEKKAGLKEWRKIEKKEKQ